MLHFPGIVIPGHTAVAPPGQFIYSVRSSEALFYGRYSRYLLTAR
ncbi:MAG: hypothetical protein AB7H80_12900 [Candidatus Kapaibacterium sp.]